VVVMPGLCTVNAHVNSMQRSHFGGLHPIGGKLQTEAASGV
jgi:hypothetical protein